MDLNQENKMTIDKLSVFNLLYKWRFAEIGDLWFQGETGKYWGERMAKLRDDDNAAFVSASKAMGWGKE